MSKRKKDNRELYYILRDQNICSAEELLLYIADADIPFGAICTAMEPFREEIVDAVMEPTRDHSEKAVAEDTNMGGQHHVDESEARRSAGKEAETTTSKDKRSGRLAAESEGLEPRIAGNFIIGCVSDINGEDAELVDFKVTRAELKTLAYHYLERHYNEQTCAALGIAAPVNGAKSSTRHGDLRQLRRQSAPPNG